MDKDKEQLLDITRSQRQEIERLDYLLRKEQSDHFETLQKLYESEQENEQLKVQNTVMRQQLEIIKDNIHEFPPEGMTIGKQIWIETTDKALSTDAANYHNPADVEVVEQAKEVLLNIVDVHCSRQAVSKVLKAIDKVIGVVVC